MQGEVDVRHRVGSTRSFAVVHGQAGDLEDRGLALPAAGAGGASAPGDRGATRRGAHRRVPAGRARTGVSVPSSRTPSGRSTRVRPWLFDARRTLRRDSPPARSRGLMNSSMPKFTRASPVPSRAMHSPGGTYHHHAPEVNASLFCTQYNIDPQLHVLMGPRPR